MNLEWLRERRPSFLSENRFRGKSRDEGRWHECRSWHWPPGGSGGNTSIRFMVRKPPAVGMVLRAACPGEWREQ